MKKLDAFSVCGAVIGGFIACILLISGNDIGETVHSWGNLITMDSLMMGIFLKIKSMTLIEVKLAIIGIFAICGFVLGMFVAAFFIADVDDIIGAMMKGAFWFALLFFVFGTASEPSIMWIYSPLIGGILGAVLGAIYTAFGEIIS